MNNFYKKAAAFVTLWMTCVALTMWIVGCSPNLESSPKDSPASAANTASSSQVVTDPESGPNPVTWTDCGQTPGEHPCDFTFVDQSGNAWTLYDHIGKVIVIDFSTMWCGVCNNIASKGDEFMQTYNMQNFVWVTVLVEDSTRNPPDADDLTHWVDTYNISAPVLAGNRADVVDLTAETGYPITAWPTLVVIDRNMVLYRGINGWNEAVVTQWVEEVL